MLPVEVREQLVHALRDDLVGPEADDPRDEPHARETLSAAPSHIYLTGFVAPNGQPLDEREDETAEEEITSGIDSAEEGEPDATPARRPLFPSSLGISVLVGEGARDLAVRVTYGTYAPAKDAPSSHDDLSDADTPPDPERSPRRQATWTRTPHEHSLVVNIDPARPRQDLKLPDSGGVYVRSVLRELPAAEVPLVPPGTRYVTLFLINQRPAVSKPEQDRGYIFQVTMTVESAAGFVPRPDLRGARVDDDMDDRIGDLQFRDAYEFAVGHGVSVTATVTAAGDPGHQIVRCNRVRTTWTPTAEVEKVSPTSVAGVELRMEELAQITNGAELSAKVGALVSRYRTWIDGQRTDSTLDTDTRRDTSEALLAAASRVADRIERGIRVLVDDAVALEAFRLANRTMAASARQRSPERYKTDPPRWYPFQLAFLLMNVPAQVDPTHAERDVVDLIFFPTGGGKTEAYLGLAAFSLVLRRLRNPGLGSAGVAVLMRYTLRLLTLDQLDRAATLICALELERRRDPARLGPQRFSIGLWVGRAATPNRFGNAQDHDPNTARNRVLAYKSDAKANPSPVPLDKCPWCKTPFGQSSFDLKPNTDAPTQLRIRCTSPGCEFRWRRESPEGVPVVVVDEEIYRELPCFLIATVDKFAGLPWVGQTGLLLGKNVTHTNELGFYGPAVKPPTAQPLPTPLLPPDLILQDELHLISGPLGTMVGLYETAIDHLATRHVEGHGGRRTRIRPKIVASTATVRQAKTQIQALFARNVVDVFPPPGPNRRDSFFAETVPTSKANARFYVGVAAPGRSMKVLLMRSYVAMLAAAQRAYARDPKAADPYMTLLGYFNSLRELGGARRIVEDEVRSRVFRASRRRRVGEAEGNLADRSIEYECVELTSRETTDKVKVSKERLDREFSAKSGRKDDRPPVDVALASNMISVGLDIQRLGLMVVCGQPKTTAEYIQATSRVGRDANRPGLVVVLLNAYKPRDRSHFEHFAAYHQSFYRGVEATSVTPFSPRAVDRGLAGLSVALARLGDPRLTPGGSAVLLPTVRSDMDFIGDVLAARVEAHRAGTVDGDPIDDVKAALRQRVESLLDSWMHVAVDDPAGDGLSYQRYEDGGRRVLLHMPLDPELDGCNQHERRFVANRSLRDVEGTADIYVTRLKDGVIALEREAAE